MIKANYGRLKELRIEKGIPAQVLTDVIESETIATYYKKEKGFLRVSLDEAKKLADFYGMTIEELFYACENSKTEQTAS